MTVVPLKLRPTLVWLHRWIGLVTALFLMLAGLTGALLVWYHELDHWAAAELYDAPGRGPVMDPLQLRERVAAAYPHARAHHVQLRAESGRAVVFHLQPPAGASAPLANDEVFVDPVTGQVIGERRWGAMLQGRVNLLPFVYQLHYSLALGDLGMLLMGVVALLWTLDCLVGLVLTLPPPARTANGPGFWRRFAPSWRVRLRSGGYRLNFDLHRAGGLWTWAMLFVLAWSSVAFNLNSVYHPVMRSVLPFEDRKAALPPRESSQQPGLTWHDALAHARAQARAEAARLGFEIVREESFSRDPATASFRYRFNSTADIRDRGGSSSVYVDDRDGRLLFTSLPTGQYAGTTLTSWLTTLHMANVWGLPFRLFVFGMGLVVASLSVTGLLIWWRKRRARRHAHQHNQKTTDFRRRETAAG